MSQSGAYETNVSPGTQPVLSVVGNDAVVVPANPDNGEINIVGISGISTSGDAGNYTLTITASGLGSFSWVVANTDTVTMLPNTGYSVQNANQIAFSLPSTCAFGQIIKIAGYSENGWTVLIGSGQSILMNESTATISLTSTKPKDFIELLCITADTVFEVTSSMGNITID